MRFHFPIMRRVSLPMLLLFKLLIVLLLMSLSRWLFYIFNLSEFSHIDFFELMRLMFLGLRFDLSAVFMVNLPLIALLTLPITTRYESYYQAITKVLFVFANALALAVNLVDVIYFRYISRRTTYEIFQFFGSNDENVLPLFGQFFLDFWYMFLIWLIFVWILYRAAIFFIPGNPWPVRKLAWFMWQSVIFIVFILVSVVFIRGGFQLKPINLVTAGMRTSAQNIPLVLNTPFAIIKTINQQILEEKHFFPEAELAQIYTPVKRDLILNHPHATPGYKDHNVVVLILESFGREHIGYYNQNRRQSITPFLDSLLTQSYTFEAWANGKRSIEAMPAIVASIPTLMPVDYPTSPYITNRIKGLGTLLGEKGYHTSFFHGGNNGTMSFDAFANASGFVHYFGRNEYGNDADFDGKWGIFDLPFLQFVAEEMNQFPQPFVSGIFTLSSHHPYTIPDEFEDAFPTAHNRLERSIAYTDLALKQFFNRIKDEPWFENTIFAITADHTSESNEDPLYRTALGNYAIPVAFFAPGKHLQGKGEFTAQQTDIMPSLLALLEYDKTVVAFGENLFDSTAHHFAINFNNNIYQLVKDDFLLHFNGKVSLALFDLVQDPLKEHNLLRKQDSIRESHQQFIRAIIQQYNNRLISNQLIQNE